MAFEHPYGSYNVQGSLNEWFRVNVTGNGIPAWMPSAFIHYDFPETGLISGHSGHAFSLTHQGADPIQQYQGRIVGDGQRGTLMESTLEVNCWLSREKAGGAYTHRLRHMGDMVSYIFQSARDVPLTNVYGSTTDPENVTALIRIKPANEQPVLPDPNPDIVRRRFLIDYRWLERVSAG
ncbi:hypothetical protein LCGC14_2943550 [marine sediment metagenome]|uniref:Uncharacterized protein n=1 Tax=marine sediment metagenome TaxID=412755 RepID=A0A0F9A8B8_9ZZZZ